MMKEIKYKVSRELSVPLSVRVYIGRDDLKNIVLDLALLEREGTLLYADIVGYPVPDHEPLELTTRIRSPFIKPFEDISSDTTIEVFIEKEEYP